MQRLKGVAIFGVVAALVLPASAAAERVTFGSTEGDQYTEVVPNGGGSTLDTGSGGTGGSQGLRPLRRP